jgi:autotransporter-associated beta strand protein
MPSPPLRGGRRSRPSTARVDVERLDDRILPASYSWTQFAGGVYNWNDPANWGGAGFPNAPDDSANLALDISGTLTINLNVPITVGTVTFGDFSGFTPGNFNVVGNGGKLIFESTGATALLFETQNISVDMVSAPIQLNSPLLVNNSRAFQINGPISGPGKLSKNGTANLTLSGTNTSLGGVSIAGGTVTVADASNLGPGPLTFETTSALNITGSAVTIPNNISLGNDAVVTVKTPPGSATVLSGNISGGPTTTWFLQDTVSGAGGSVALTGANTFQGPLTVREGTLIIGSPTAAGVGTLNAKLLQFGGNFTIANNVQLATSQSIRVGDGISAGISGVLSGGMFPFTKVGGGTLTLSGANTYSVDTMVNEGTLNLANATGSGTGTGAVTVNNPATLSGSGSTSGIVKINAGGTATLTGATGPATALGDVSPGGATPGILSPASITFTDGVGGGTFVATLNGTAPGTGYDQLVVGGTTNLANANLRAAAGFAYPDNTTLVLINNTSANPIAGTFSGLPEGALLRVNDQYFAISYVGGDGNDVVLVSKFFPQALSINRVAPADPASSATSAQYTVTFNQPVSGVDAADFRVVTTNTLKTGAVAVTGSGATYTVTVSDIHGAGDLRLDLIDDDSIIGLHALGGPGFTNGSFQSQAVSVVQAAAPFVTIARTAPAPLTSATSVAFTVTFAAAVTGVDSSDFVVTRSGAVNFANLQVTPVSGSVYTVVVSGVAGNGSVGINLIDDGSIRDALNAPLSVGDGAAFFAPEQTFFTGISGAVAAKGVAAGDVNGDGKSDVVVVASSATLGFVSVLLGNGNGAFQGQQTSAAGAGARDVALSDINGDGRLDLTVLNDSAESVGVLFGRGDGTFQAQQTFASPSSLFGTALGDVNGDGRADVVLANANNNSANILLGNGNGTFQAPQTFAAGANPRAVVAADFNSDGKLDLAFNGNSSVSIVLGNGNGAFQAPRSFAAIGSPSALAVGDVNRDGKFDLVTASLAGNSLSLLLGNGDGSFQSQSTYAVGGPASVAIGDVSGDGYPDIVAGFGGSVAILLGNGDGSFQAQQTFAGGSAGLVLGDFDNDARPDIAALGGAPVHILLAKGSVRGPSYVVDQTAPFVQSINRATPAGPLTNASSVTFTVTFSESVTGVDLNGFVLTKSGTANANLSQITGSGSIYTVTVDGIIGVGSLGLNFVSSSSVRDAAGNATQTGATGQSFTVDRVAPVVVSINRAPATNAATVSFVVTFSEDVTGVDLLDFFAVRTGTVGAALTQLTGTGNVYTVTFSGVTGSGSLGLNLVDNGTIRDTATNALPGGTIVGQVATVDPLAPTIVSLSRTTPAAFATNGTSVVFTITFSEAVTGADIGDFTLVKTGTVANLAPQFAGSGSVYTITVAGITGEGTLGLNFVDNNSVRDGNDNALSTSLASFANQATYTAGTDVVAVLAADVNGDGKTDLVSGNLTGQAINVLLGNGDGTFKPASVMALGKRAGAIAAHDFNSDGIVDLVVGTSTNGDVLVLLGNGNGTYRPPISITTGGPIAVSTADINADGFSDIVAANGASIAIVLSNGNGTFQPVVQLPTAASECAAAGDLNGDGKVDVVYSSRNPQSIGIFFGNGDGTFGPRVTFATPALLPPSSVAVGDLNADGKADVVFSSDTGRSVAAVFGNGNGTFGPATTFATSNAAVQQVGLADVNRDGKADLVLANNGVTLLLGNGDGTFRPPALLATQSGQISAVVTDVNGDGRPDIAASGKYSHTLGVLLSRKADLTGPAYTIDRTAPAATITVKPSALSNNPAPAFSFTGADPSTGGIASGVDHFEYQLDGGAFTTAVSPFTLPNLVSGNHTFAVRAVDAAGNVGVAASYIWAVDVAAPTTTILGQPPTLTAASASFTFSALDPLAGGISSGVKFTEYQFDGGPFLTATSPVTLNDLVSGNHTFAVRAVDNAGNAGPLASFSWLVDATAPTMQSIVPALPAPFVTNATPVPFTVTFSEPVTGVDAADFQATGLAGTVSSVVPVNGSTFTVTVSGVSGSGKVGLNLVDNGSIRDAVSRVLFSTKPAIGGTLTYSVGASVQSIVAADLNGDGKVDLAAANGGDQTFSILLGNGDGTFRPRVVVPFGSTPNSLRVVDVNGDGKIDLVASDGAAVSVLLANGDGTFRPRIDTNAGSLQYFDVGDANTDGKVDVATISAGATNDIKIYLGNGDGTFQATPAIPAVAGTLWLKLADFSSDGKADLVSTSFSDKTLSLFLGNGDGTFRPRATFSTGSGFSSPLVGDMNGDRRLDVVQASASISVLLGNGDGTFRPRMTSFGTGSPASALADFNGDGRPDLIGVGSVLLGNGDGSFQSSTVLAAGGVANEIAVGDFNGDGRPDLVSPDGSQGLTVLLNANGSFAGSTADVDQAAPTVSIDDAPPAVTNSSSASFAFHGNDPTVGGVSSGLNRFEFQLDGGAFLATTSPLVLNALSAGAHTLNVRAVDNAGNAGLATFYTWNINLAPTTTTLSASPNATTGGELVTFTATVTPTPGNLGTVTFKDNGTPIPGGANVPLAGGAAIFTTSTLPAGTRHIRADYSGALGFASSTSNTLNFTVTASAPQIVRVSPNENIPSLAGAQRSRVASLVVVFNQPVQLDANALALAMHPSNVALNGVPQPAGYGVLPSALNWTSTDNVAWIVTFAGNTEDGADGIHSLQDGVYDLAVEAVKVHPLGVPGINMAANAVTTFHRLFGDVDAPETPAGGAPGIDFQAIVNTGDNFAFRTAFNRPEEYKAFLDFDGSGVINTGDNLEFRNRFNNSLTWKA